MKTLKIGGIALAALTALFLGVALFLPSQFRVSRSLAVAAPPVEVYALLSDVRRSSTWSPWKARDSSMELTFGGPERAVGSWYAWTSRHSGEGKATVVALDSPRRVELELEFHEKGHAQSAFEIERGPAGSQVAWIMSGDVGWSLPARYFVLFADSIMGPDFTDGLERIKALVEAGVTTSTPTVQGNPITP